MENMIVCSGNMVSVEGVPDEVKILPLGMVHSQKGDFLVDDESVLSIIRHFKERRLDVVIDYEHQTLRDIQAPAGGWITEIRKGEDALVAKVKWTDRAAEYLKNKEYRYLSPVVMVDKKDRRARVIHSVALTNTPAIDGMFALVNSIDIAETDKQESEGSEMDLKEVTKLLGLPEDAAEADVRKALESAGKTLEGQKQENQPAGGTQTDAGGAEAVANSEKAADPVILSLLGLKEDAKTADVAAAVMALQSGGTAQAELLKLKEELEKRNADDLVQTALKEGKITAAQKEWAQSYALSDSDGFKAFMEKAPVVVPQGKMEFKDAQGGKKADYDLAILKNTGLTEEDVKKYYRED